jgi:hypothetical protein
VLGLNIGRDTERFNKVFLKGFFTKDERTVFGMSRVAVKNNSRLSIPGSAHNGFWLLSTLLRERNDKVPNRKIGVKKPVILDEGQR